MDEPRTFISVETPALALSLLGRLEVIRGLGERGVSVSPEGCGVTLDEYPRKPDEANQVLEAVGAWLDEVGHPQVTVEFRWPVRRSPAGRSRAQRKVLYWKAEDGPGDGNGSPDDVGPAWLQTHDERGNVTSEPLSEGEWISRQEAAAIAIGEGYTLSLDD